MVSNGSMSRLIASFAERLLEELYASTKTEYEVEREQYINIVVRLGAAILQLLTCEDQAL